MHLPRFFAKIIKYLVGELPKSYQRNFTQGFDGFLCIHLGVDPQRLIELVKECTTELEIENRLAETLTQDLKFHEWNRKLVQIGMSQMGTESLAQNKAKLGISDRTDLISYADMIDFDEDKIN